MTNYRVRVQIMSEVVNLLQLEPGTKLGLANGSTVEVVTNLGDGVWIFGRYLSSPSDPSLEGTEEMVFAQEIVEVLETA